MKIVFKLCKIILWLNFILNNETYSDIIQKLFLKIRFMPLKRISIVAHALLPLSPYMQDDFFQHVI